MLSRIVRPMVAKLTQAGTFAVRSGNRACLARGFAGANDIDKGTLEIMISPEKTG